MDLGPVLYSFQGELPSFLTVSDCGNLDRLMTRGLAVLRAIYGPPILSSLKSAKFEVKVRRGVLDGSPLSMLGEPLSGPQKANPSLECKLCGLLHHPLGFSYSVVCIYFRVPGKFQICGKSPPSHLDPSSDQRNLTVFHIFPAPSSLPRGQRLV